MDMWMDVDTALSEVPVNLMPLIDDTDFKTRETAVAYNAAGMDLVWNFVTTGGAYTQTAVTPTTGGSYDWTHQGDGMYSIEIPASGGASINNDTEGFGWFSGVATGVLPWRGPVIGFRAAALNDALIDSAWSTTRGLAGTALPNAAADAPGGLPISDAGGLDLDAKLANTNEVTAARMGALTDWIDGGRLDLLLDAVKAKTDSLTFTVANTLNVAVTHWLTTGVSALPTNFSQLSITAGGVVSSNLETIKTQSITCSAAVTIYPFVGFTGSTVSGSTLTTFMSNDGVVQWKTMVRGFLDGPATSTSYGAYVSSLSSGTLSTVTDYYKGCYLKLLGGTGATPGGGQIRRITGSVYDAGNDWVIFSIKRPFATAPDTNTSFVILPSDAGLLTDDIDADSVKADAVTEIQNGLATSAELDKVPKSDSNVTWNATAAAQIQSEATDALNAYDPPTNAEMVARTLATADYSTATALALVAAKLPVKLSKNTAFTNWVFKMVDETDHVTPETGLTITATRSLDGAAFASCTNTATEISNGWYKIDLSAADLNGNSIILKFTATGADANETVIITQPA